jgi:hypothetical protein
MLGFLGTKFAVGDVYQCHIQLPNKATHQVETRMDYNKGFERGRVIGQNYSPPTGDEPDEYIEGWVDGRMEQIRYEDPTTADKFEAIFLGAEGFGKATYRDMLEFLTADDETVARRLEQASL